jgi:TrbB protein
MKNKDTIKLFGHAMMVEYGATGQTGSISVLRLDREVRFAIEGDAIRASYVSDPAGALVERFASAELAKNAYQHLQSVIKRYVFMRRMRNGMTRLTLWGVMPIAATILLLSMNLALTRGMEAQAAPVAVPSASAAPAVAAASVSRAAPASAEIAKAMQDGANAGKFSIPLTHGKKGTLYVFSDPACSYCRALEPELQKLGKNYTIHVFPVSVIGGRGSANAISSVMCRKPSDRAAAWKTLLAKRGTSESPCNEGDNAIAANDEMFRAIGFAGTPAIVGGDGSTYPDAGHNTEATIMRWLKMTGQ